MKSSHARIAPTSSSATAIRNVCTSTANCSSARRATAAGTRADLGREACEHACGQRRQAPAPVVDRDARRQQHDRGRQQRPAARHGRGEPDRRRHLDLARVRDAGVARWLRCHSQATRNGDTM